MAGGLFPPMGNSIYAGGTPREHATATYKVKTTTNLKPGTFVIKDTTDSEIKAAGAAALNVIGVMSRNLTDHDAELGDTPAAGDEIEVILCGSGAWAWVRNNANVAAGDRIETDASGTAAKASVQDGSPAAGDSAKIVGRALIDNDGSGGESDILVVL